MPTVAGVRGNNTAIPSTDNEGVLPAVANAAAPSLTEGYQTLLSVDLTGGLRTISVSSTAQLGSVAIVSGSAAVGTFTLATGGIVALSSGSAVFGALTANQTVNLALIGGQTLATGTGASGAGVPRVTVSNDSSIILAAGSATIGALTANQSVTLPNTNRSDTYTTTTSGVTVPVSTTPAKAYSVQVVGTGAAATTWDVRLEGSLDNVNFTQILQHTDTIGNTIVLFSGSSLYPALYFRSRCAGLVLGTATNIVVFIAGIQ